MQLLKKIQQRPFFIKLFNWEYWPFNIVYAPMYLYWFFYLSFRARAFFFFNTSNPTIRNGGFLLESKKEIYDLIPQVYYPATLLFEAGADPERVVQETTKANIAFPLIAKPDIGMRGMAVEKIENETALRKYVELSQVDFLVQAFVSYEKEVGIFYYRIPGESKGHITGIVGKEFVTLTGNGVDSIETLMQLDPRYILQLPFLRKPLAEELKMVLPAGQSHVLVPFGNHSRGAKFLDISYLIDQTLTDSIDHICQQIDGFYYGRIDMRYVSWEKLVEGKEISIIELNGAGSEPTHIYDPRHSIFFAWKEIIRHWSYMIDISIINHKRLKIPYMSVSDGLKMIEENKAYIKKIEPKR